MKWKIRLQKDFLILFIIAIVTILLYLQYTYSKKNLIDKYKSEEYAKSLQIESKFKSILDNIELIFKSKLDENLKALNTLYLMYNGIDKFDANKIANILNKSIKIGKYEVFVIDKNGKIIKASYKPDLGLNLGKFKKYKKIFDDIFNGKQKINISYLIFDYSSFSLNQYFLIRSPDKKYILQLAYVVDIYPKLKEAYYEFLNKFRDLREIKLYFMDKYFIYPINLKKRHQYKKQIEEVIKESTNIFYQFLNDMNKKVDKNLSLEVLGKRVINFFHVSGDRISKLDLNNHEFVTYSLIEGFFKNFSNRLIIKSEYSTYILEKDIEAIRNRFLVMILSLIILAILVKFVIYYITRQLSILVEHMKQNMPIEKTNYFIKEFDELVKTYNEYREKLNQEIEKNQQLLMENKRFIVDTVHQLKTPLSVITLNSDFLKMQLKDKNLEYILNEIEAAIAMLTNSYEDLSYLAAQNAIEYKPVKLNVSEIARQRVNFFMPLAKARNKVLVSDIDEDIFFDINKVELERLIDNNISNAIDYSKNKEIKIVLKKLDDGFVLRVESFGEKIRNPKKIFEKNYREYVHKRGLGIGLNIVKNICEKYNIEYKVISENGKNIFEYIFKY